MRFLSYSILPADRRGLGGRDRFSSNDSTLVPSTSLGTSAQHFSYSQVHALLLISCSLSLNSSAPVLMSGGLGAWFYPFPPSERISSAGVVLYPFPLRTFPCCGLVMLERSLQEGLFIAFCSPALPGKFVDDHSLLLPLL